MCATVATISKDIIDDLIEVIRMQYNFCGGLQSITFDEEHMVFNIEELVPYPVYVGGSIDSVEFEVCESQMSYEEACEIRDFIDCWNPNDIFD